MALAAKNAPGHQDHLVSGATPRFPDCIDASGRNGARIDTGEIDSARHHREFAPGRALAVVHEVRELLAGDDHTMPARHGV
jgi:hypothetical protein